MWLASMFAIVPLMASREKIRAWGILCAVGAIEGAMRPDQIWAFALIDAMAALYLLHNRRYLPEKVISLIFAAMLCIHGGFIAGRLVHGEADLATYADLQRGLGWWQLATLAVWGGVDAVRYGYHRFMQRGVSPHTVRGFR